MAIILDADVLIRREKGTFDLESWVAAMVIQFRRMFRPTVTLDIARRGNGEDRRFYKLACNKGREARLSEAYSEIYSL